MFSAPLILASVSPRRKELLGQLKVEFEVIPGEVEEVGPGHLSPRELCQINAYRKARVVAEDRPDAVVLAADTVVCLGARIYGKPVDQEDAVRILTELEGKTHEVITGVCLMQVHSRRTRVFAVATSVTFRSLGRTEIDDYLRRINPMDKAGAYAIQEFGELIVEEVCGSFSNVVGLPLERVEEELREWSSG